MRDALGGDAVGVHAGGRRGKAGDAHRQGNAGAGGSLGASREPVGSRRRARGRRRRSPSWLANSNASPPRNCPTNREEVGFRDGPNREAEGSPEGSLSEWAEQTPSRRPERRTGAAKHAVREAARSAAEKINIADADTNDAEEDPPAKKGALERNAYGFAFEGHGGSPVAAYAKGYPTSGEAQQSWSGKMSIVDLNPHQQGLVVWLVSLGLDVTGTELVEGKDGGCEIVRLPKAAHVQAEAAKGILLSDLACLLEGAFMEGLIQRPKVKEECMHNINKALAALRRGGVTNTRYLWSAAEIARGDGEAVWGLLGDIKTAYKGFPARRKRCKVSQRVDARFAGNKSPLADGGSLRSSTPPRKNRSSAPAAELNFGTDGGSDWRRARPGTTLRDRGVPSPLADAAHRVSPTRRGFSFSTGPARPRARAPRRSPMGDRSPNVDKSRLKHPRQSEDDLQKRPPFTNSGYVSPNESARKRAVSAPRFRDRSPSPMMGEPHGIHSGASPHSTRARSVSPRHAPRPGEDPARARLLLRAFSPGLARRGPAGDSTLQVPDPGPAGEISHSRADAGGHPRREGGEGRGAGWERPGGVRIPRGTSTTDASREAARRRGEGGCGR